MRSLAAFLLLASASLSTHAQESWQVSRGDVRVLCPLTVGGSFEAKTSSLSGVVRLSSPKPAAFSGELSVDLRTLDTGISLRNTHMKDNYLEVGKAAGYETAVLSSIKLPGVDAATASGKVQFTGDFRVHGITKTVTGTAEIKRSGTTVKIVAKFPVLLPDFSVPKPRYLGVGVKDQVEVNVSFDAIGGGAAK